TAVANSIARSAEARTIQINAWFQHFLGRPAGAGEAQPWVNLFLQGQTEESVLSTFLVNYYAGQSNNDFVTSVYQGLFGRAPTASELLTTTSILLPQLGRWGVVWQLANSPTYRTQVVTGFYLRLLRRTPSPAEVNGWVNSGLDFATIRVSFLASLEFYNSGL